MPTPMELLQMARQAGVQFPDLPPALQEAVASGRMDEATARQRALANRPQYRQAMGLPATPADAAIAAAGGNGAAPQAKPWEGGGGAFPPSDAERLGNGGPSAPRSADTGQPPGSGSPFVRMAMPAGSAAAWAGGRDLSPEMRAQLEQQADQFRSMSPEEQMRAQITIAGSPSDARTSGGSSDRPQGGASPWSRAVAGNAPNAVNMGRPPGSAGAGGAAGEGTTGFFPAPDSANSGAPGSPRAAGKTPGMLPSGLGAGMDKPRPQLADLAELAGGPPRPQASVSAGGLQGAGAPAAPTDPKPQLSDLASTTAGGFRADPAAENRRRMMEQRRVAGAALGQKAY